VAVKKMVFGAEMRIQTWKWTLAADAGSDHHWQPCSQSRLHLPA